MNEVKRAKVKKAIWLLNNSYRWQCTDMPIDYIAIIEDMKSIGLYSLKTNNRDIVDSLKNYMERINIK